jgi:hypothetical protein
MDAEIAGIRRLLPLVGEGRTLFLGFDVSDNLEPTLAAALKEEIARGLVVLSPQKTDIFLSRAGHDILSLTALAASLSALSEDQARNLVVLIPDQVGWDETGLDRQSVLDYVGFVLLRDFVAGIPVDHMALRNIGHLAEMVATQA